MYIRDEIIILLNLNNVQQANRYIKMNWFIIRIYIQFYIDAQMHFQYYII